MIESSFALEIIPVAMGCSEFCSNADAMRIISFSSIEVCSVFTLATSNFPNVSVPVLSKIIVVIFLAFSNAVLFFISKPFFAESDVEIATTNGTASPKACGQQITITVTILSSANTAGLPAIDHQKKNVMNPETSATIVRILAALSASNWVFDFAFWASFTSPITRERYESFDEWLTVTLNEPLPLMEPAMTFIPFCFFTGTDSPVIMDSFR